MNKNIKLDLLEKENTLLKMENEKLKANQDYIAILCDVDLEEDNEQELRKNQGLL